MNKRKLCAVISMGILTTLLFIGCNSVEGKEMNDNTNIEVVTLNAEDKELTYDEAVENIITKDIIPNNLKDLYNENSLSGYEELDYDTLDNIVLNVNNFFKTSFGGTIGLEYTLSSEFKELNPEKHIGSVFDNLGLDSYSVTYLDTFDAMFVGENSYIFTTYLSFEFVKNGSLELRDGYYDVHIDKDLNNITILGVTDSAFDFDKYRGDTGHQTFATSGQFYNMKKMLEIIN